MHTRMSCDAGGNPVSCTTQLRTNFLIGMRMTWSPNGVVRGRQAG